MRWFAVDTGHELAIIDRAIVARSGNGRQLKSVPPKAKKTDAYAQLDNLLTFLHLHDEQAGREVERWFLRSQSVPLRLVAEVWADESWRSWLRDLVVATDDGTAGLLRHADGDGLGVVDLDGESATVAADSIRIPHPALLPDLDDWRGFAAELGVRQRFDQLFREVHPLPRPLPPEDVTALHDWAGATFEQQRHAAGRAAALGYRLSGGYITTTIHEDGRRTTARYWLGAEHPEAEAVTGELHWLVDGSLAPVATLGPVAYSEGVRMARAIHAARKPEETK